MAIKLSLLTRGGFQAILASVGTSLLVIGEDMYLSMRHFANHLSIMY